ncbi:MAG: hypothetical protein EOO06_02040 [Chitinophagaceae bacterium]|nr:MAG: hypothetical protein EOO06_02040 [Chitinophagaceae bacterium]
MNANPLYFCCILIVISMSEAKAQSFEGSFAGQQPGIASAAITKVNDAELTGRFELNGRPGKFRAKICANNCEGFIHDEQMQKDYSFTGRVTADSLYLFIRFPELDDQLIVLQMSRQPEGPPAVGGARAKALIGLWRYTETFSSGSGDNYASFSTDYFMEFKEDGTAISWKGKSAGGMGGMSLEGKAGTTQTVGWHTSANRLFLVDPVSGAKSTLLFSADANRLMLHNGGSEKKIMERVR